MAQIRNLEAQREALSEVESLLKEIHVINEFLIKQKEYGSSTYTISFLMSNPTEKDALHSSDLPETALEDDEASKKKRGKKGSKNLKIEAPFLCENNDIIRAHVLYAKQEKANKIEELSREFNIFLDDKDMAILNMFKEEL